MDTDSPVPLRALDYLTMRRGRLQPSPDSAKESLLSASAPELEPVPATPYLWSELRQTARAEGVVHLDDLLLRRVRLGLLGLNGGTDLLPRIRAMVQPELGWDDERWEEEVNVRFKNQNQ